MPDCSDHGAASSGSGASAPAGGAETCVVLGGLQLPARSEEARPWASGVQDAKHTGEMWQAANTLCLLPFDF